KDDVAIGVIDDASAVVVREEQVVELGEETRWSGRVRVGEGSIADIEQLTTALVPKHSQLGAQALADVAERRQPRPRRDVRDGRWTEGFKVAPDEGLNRRLGVDRVLQPEFRRRPGGLGAPAPDPARWHLD